MANLYRFKQDFCAISQFGILANGGVSRIAFSKADHEARNYLIDKMRQANLQVSIDPAGNIRGLRNGSNPSLPAVMIGSHLDSVPQGGHYDGVVGVLAALEVIRALDDSGIKTLRSVEIVNFAAEESSRFGMATIGSKAITGKLSIDKMKELRDSDGASLFQVLSNSGCQLENLESAILTRSDLHAYLELHIEQGPILENKQLDVGIVTAIAAPSRFYVNIIGRNDHSGNTPMSMRYDALTGAAEVVLAVETLAKAIGGNLVGTVGELAVKYGAMNVVPGEVKLSIDLRDTDLDNKNCAVAQLKQQLHQVASTRKLKIELTPICDEAPIALNEKIAHLLCDQAEKLKLKYKKMSSGAGHDAMHFADITSAGLIFIPSINGVSHNIAEKTTLEDINNGINLLFNSVEKLANDPSDGIFDEIPI